MNVIEVALNSGMKHLLIEIRQMVNIKLGHERKKGRFKLSCDNGAKKILFPQARAPPGQEPQNLPARYDGQHETERKKQLLKLFNRTQEQVLYRPLPMNFGTCKND